MENLFSYGSLQNPDIQVKLFNRILEGKSDILPNYDKTKIDIEGKKYNAAYSKMGVNLEGTVYELTQTELERADRYEGKSYKRIRIKLLSGVEAWFYMRA